MCDSYTEAIVLASALENGVSLPVLEAGIGFGDLGWGAGNVFGCGGFGFGHGHGGGGGSFNRIFKGGKRKRGGGRRKGKSPFKN